MKTGWQPHLLQDDSRKLSDWFASRVDARWAVRQVCAEIERNRMSEKQPEALKFADDLDSCSFGPNKIATLLRTQHAITSENGNAPPEGASAITSESVPLLSDAELLAMLVALDNDTKRLPSGFRNFARAVEQAVRSKLGAGVPMTPFSPAQLERLYRNTPERHRDATSMAAFKRIIKLAEAAHGIVGKEGGNV